MTPGVMTTGVMDLVLMCIAAAVILSVVLGAVDLIRQPGWAWRAAGEPKWLALMLVLLLPGVGLAIYVFGARPKVVAVASAGRAANLPFERFGDRQTLATENVRAIQVLAQPTSFGSFGERRTTRPVRASGPAVGAPAGTDFFDDPDLVTVGDPTRTTQTIEPAATVATTGEPPIRIPGSLGRPYNPRQRTSFDERESLASVAAQVQAANQGAGPHLSALATTPVAPSPGVGAGGPVPTGGPAGAGEVAGRTFATAASAFGQRPPAHAANGRATALQLGAAPVATPRTPEIFRPRPDEVAPIATGSATAVATMTPRATMAARWLPDPTGRHQYRYWDGGCWTENVYDAGVESRDPVLD